MRYLAFIAAMLVLFVSCSNSQAKPSDPSGVSAPVAMEFDGEDDVLRIAMVKPSSVDPADLVLTDQAQVILSDLLYDGLTEVETNSGRLRPGLAKSWKPNNDFTAWIFELDPNRLTADQIRASFERQDNQQSAIISELMSIVGSIEVLSEFELRFELLQPSAGFPWLASGPGMAVTTGDNETSGRLRTISEDNNGMILVSPGGMSDIDIRWTETEDEAYTLLESGGVDVAVGTSVASPSGQALGHVRFVAINSASMRLTEPADRAFVRSILQAVDTSETDVASAVVEIQGLSSPALAGSPSLLCRQGCQNARPTGAASTNEIELRLGVSSEADLRVAEVVREAFIDSNISIEVVQTTPEQLAQKIAAGDIDMMLFGWVAGAGSVDAVVPSLIQSEAPGNIFQLQNDRSDELLGEASKVGNDKDRWELIAEAESLAISSDVVVSLGAIRSKVRTNGGAASLVVRADGTLDTFRY